MSLDRGRSSAGTERVPKSVGNWWVEVIDPDTHHWRGVGGTLWTPEPMTGEQAIKRALKYEDGPRWARAFCMPTELGSHYDLHYPEGFEPPIARRPGALGPHLWVPAPEAYYLAAQRDAARSDDAT